MKYFDVASSDYVPARRVGKSKANLAYIKFALKQNLKLVIATGNQKQLLEDLREAFPTAMFVLVGNWGVEIKIRNKEELIL